MVDFHAHILPCADHGSDSLETSLKQIQFAKEAGVTTIIATPHFYMNNDNLDDFLSRREKSYNELVSNLNDNSISIIKGCEVSLQVDLFKLKNLKELCIEGTNYMLLEMPMKLNWTHWHYDAIDELISLGIEPIIAHINRYPSFYLKKLFEKDIMFQINIEAFTTLSSRIRMKKFFNKGYANFIGSDIHGANPDYYDFMKKYSKKYNDMFRIFEFNSLNILKSIKKS